MWMNVCWQNKREGTKKRPSLGGDACMRQICWQSNKTHKNDCLLNLTFCIYNGTTQERNECLSILLMCIQSFKHDL